MIKGTMITAYFKTALVNFCDLRRSKQVGFGYRFTVDFEQ